MSVITHSASVSPRSGSEAPPVEGGPRTSGPQTVLLVISDLEFGGAQRQVVELANQMDPDRFRVHVCSLADYVPLSEGLRDAATRLHIVRKAHKFDFRVIPKLAGLMRRLRADVVHTFLFDADFFGRLAARLAGVPVIIGSERCSDYVPLRRHLWAYALTRSCNDLIIANSRVGAEFNSRTFNVPASKYRVVHNGVDTKRFSPRDASTLRRELQIEERHRVVGMFASFKPQKNHPLLLRAARRIIDRVPDVRFLFVGDELYLGMSGSVDYKSDVEDLVDRLGLRGHCLFLGNRKDVENYYPLCDLTVLPSLSEGTPNAALESMACGVPVVATDVSENHYVIPDGRAGYTVSLGDDVALANRIGDLLGDETLRLRMAREARLWVLSEFSGERLAEKTAAIYEEAIRSKMLASNHSLKAPDPMPPIVSGSATPIPPAAPATSPARCVKTDLLGMAEKFAGWMDRAGYASFDPYDLWGTKYGLWARKTYYERGVLGVPLIAPVLLVEILMPGVRRFLVKKERFATADAQLLLGFLNLFAVTTERKYLAKAIGLADDLMSYAIPGYRGLCWGYPFDWQTNKGMWKKNTPFITSTPYCFEAFLGLYDATGEARYLEWAASIAEFVYWDLKDTVTGSDSSAGSYSPHDQTKVINASAYRAFVLIEAAERLGRPEFKSKALRNLRFVLENQRADGAWLYAIGNPAEAFIDHFHTCFVLKNLFKLNRHLNSGEVRQAIEKGYAYYRRSLFDGRDQPKSFAIEPRRQIVRLEMYNVAEAITLGALLVPEVPEALALADTLACRLGGEYQLSAGHFITRIYQGGRRHTLPFMRWPQAQLFYATTNLLARKTLSTDQRLASPRPPAAAAVFKN